MLLGAGWCYWRGGGRLFGFLIFASIFEASSALNLGSSGLQPYYFVACLFIFSQWRHLKLSGKSLFPGAGFLLLFVCVAVTTAFVCPVLFAGLPVYSPTISMDEGLRYQVPLALGFSNIVQSCFLVLNALVVIGASQEKETGRVDRFFDFTFYFLVCVLFVQFSCQLLGVPFPYSLLQNNPGYSMATIAGGDVSARLAGTFTEPSGAGLALTIFFGAYFHQYYCRSRSLGKLVLAVVALGITRSSSSIIAVVIIAAFVIVGNPPFRFPWYIRPRRLLKVIVMSLVPIAVIFSSLRIVFSAQTTEKTGSESFISRVSADLYAIHVASVTHWLGAGLGSNRPSSLIASLLSSVGVPGTILLAGILICLAKPIDPRKLWVRWAMIAAVVDMCFGVPDINQPLLWSMMALAAHYTARDSPSARHAYLVSGESGVVPYSSAENPFS